MSGVHYTPSGALCNYTLGWGSSDNFHVQYNNRLQVAHVQDWASFADPISSSSICTAQEPGGGYQNFLDLDYSYADANGHNNGDVQWIGNWNNWGRTQYFTYDGLNRLASATTDDTNQPHYQGENNFAYCWGESYGYDAWGNLLSIGTANSNYTGCNQESLSVSVDPNSNRITGYTYDTAGNVISIPTVGSYSYDAENHLLSAAGVTYSYDGDGHRASKSSGIDYYYDGNGQPLAEFQSDGNRYYRSFFFDGKRLVGQEGLAMSGNTNWMDQFWLDGLGSTRGLYNYESSVTGQNDDIDYYPFGGERDYVDHSANAFKFAGDERDPETGLDNSEARYYSSQNGRFMSPDPGNAGADPTNPQSWNMYSYVLNNPLNATDPTGLDCVYINRQSGTIDSTATQDPTVINNCAESPYDATFYIDGNIADITGGPFSFNVEYCPYSQFYTGGTGGVTTNCSPNDNQYRWTEIGISPPPPCQGNASSSNPCGSRGSSSGGTSGSGSGSGGGGGGPAVAAAGTATAVCEIGEPCGAVENTGLIILGVVDAVLAIHNQFFGKKRDTKQADDAWSEVQKICGAVGVQLSDSHREQWHEAVREEGGGQGLAFGDLVTLGLHMFCPQAASN